MTNQNTLIENETFDEERALYGSRNVTVRHCAFDGPADGESAFKESADVIAEDCFFNLRYPFWHVHGLTVRNAEMTELCRAALWYSDDILIEDTKLHGIKALRECERATLRRCDIISPEFGWNTRGLNMEDCTAQSEYFLMGAADIALDNVRLEGKYSFQYVRGGTIARSDLRTKDAFWHSEGLTVTDSVLTGEYLAWYSKDLTLVRCKIIGTQPLCYCEGLTLIDCEMIDCDLAFEKSNVTATVTTPIDSVKNPRSGRICAPAVGEIILDDPGAQAEIVVG